MTHVIEPLLAALVKKANAKNKGGMEIKPPHVKYVSHILAQLWDRSTSKFRALNALQLAVANGANGEGAYELGAPLLHFLLQATPLGVC